MNITLRDIPETVIAKIRTAAQKERRSLNSQILTIIEHSLAETLPRGATARLSIAAQLGLWQQLAGHWIDDRSAEEISAEVLASRTSGREVTFDSP